MRKRNYINKWVAALLLILSIGFYFLSDTYSYYIYENTYVTYYNAFLTLGIYQDIIYAIIAIPALLSIFIKGKIIRKILIASFAVDTLSHVISEVIFMSYGLGTSFAMNVEGAITIVCSIIPFILLIDMISKHRIPKAICLTLYIIFVILISGTNIYYAVESVGYLQYDREYFFAYLFSGLSITFMNITMLLEYLTDRDATYIISNYNTRYCRHCGVKITNSKLTSCLYCGTTIDCSENSITHPVTIAGEVATNKSITEIHPSGENADTNMLDSLRELKSLLNEGLISQEDYDAKKSHIIGF